MTAPFDFNINREALKTIQLGIDIKINNITLHRLE
jgi:hypothetical protein